MRSLIKIDRKVAKELPINEKELASLSDRDLESYEWGTHMDNSLTLMTRMGRFDLF